MSSTLGKVGAVVAGIVVVLTALVAIRLGALEREGPAHEPVFIADGIPATLYLPSDDVDGRLPYQQPEGERPPVVVIAHGYSADQAAMSAMARSFAEAGYAALTFDFRGHGSNTHRFAGDLTDDFEAVVDWVERSPYVDGDRIAVLGHSMGASAALAFGSLDDRPVAVIPVSGGTFVHDEVLPENVFLQVAENDPDRIHERQAEILADLGERTEVVMQEVPGTDHLTILVSNTAMEQLIGFLDPIMDIERAGETPGLDDARLPVAARYLFLMVVMFGLVGVLLGRASRPITVDAGARPLVVLAAALVATAPIMAVGGLGILPVGAGQPIAAQLFLAAGILWSVRALAAGGTVPEWAGRWVGSGPWWPDRRSLLTGLAGGLALVALLLPLGTVVHRMAPTPVRLVLWIVVGAMLLPFFAAFEALVRRGGTWRAVAWGVAGRVVLLVVMIAGLGTGVLPTVLVLVLPLLVAQFVVLELFAGPCYARGRNPAVIATAESVFIAFLIVTLTPIG